VQLSGAVCDRSAAVRLAVSGSMPLDFEGPMHY